MLINIQDVNVFFSDSGNGEPVILLHGNPDSSDIWNKVIANMANMQEHYRCIAIDLPGFGRSRAPADFDCSFENLGRFLAEVVTQVEPEQQVNLVAHDFGGAFAMAYTIMHPEKIRRLVVMNHPFFIADYRWHLLARIWRTPIVGELSMLATIWPLFFGAMKIGSKKLSKIQIRQAFDLVTPATKQMILNLYRAADPQDFQKWEPRMLAATNKIPTLVLWGEHDPYISSWVADRFGSQQVLRFKQSGHWLPAEFPEKVSRELIRFFSQ